MNVIRIFGIYLLLFGFSLNALSQSTPTAKGLNFNPDKYNENPGLLELVDSAIHCRVVLSGENHLEVGFNSVLEYSLMRLLYERAGYRHYILELSPARAHYLERYVVDDDKYAEKLIKGISSVEYFKFFKKLRDWNQTLPENDRIHILGADVERFDDLAIERVAQVFREHSKKEAIPIQILSAVKLVLYESSYGFSSRLIDFDLEESKNTDSLSKRIETLDRWNTQLLEIKSDFRSNSVQIEQAINEKWIEINSWLKTDSNEFKEAYKGIKEYNLWKALENSNQQYIWRENTLYERFSNALKENPKEGFFGQFGRCHISLTPSDIDCGWYNYKSVLNQLSANYFKGNDSILNIGIFYSDRPNSITAENVESTSNLHSELDQLKEMNLDGLALFNVNEIDRSLPQLSRKFKWVIICYSEVELNDSENDSKIEYKGKVKNIISLTPIGYAYPQILSKSLENHFINDLNLPYSSPVLAEIYGDLKWSRGFITGGIGYSILQSNTTSTEYPQTASIFQDAYRRYLLSGYSFDLNFGGNLNSQKLNLNLLAAATYFSQRLTYQALNVNIINPPAVIEQEVYQPQWLVGGDMNIEYLPNKHLGLGAQFRYRQSVGENNWYYRNTTIQYDGITDKSGMSYWSAGIHLSLYFNN